MKYDPVKSRIGKIVSMSVWLRKIFYSLLDILLLRAWHVKKALRQYVAENTGAENILDAGSGFGQYTWRMWNINKNWKILGTDIKEEQINDCNKFISNTKAAVNVSFRVTDLTSYKEDEKYDLVLCVDVMEHIENDRAVFRNFFISLREKGWLIISTPSDKGGSDVHDENDRSFIEEHVRDGYGRDEITEKLQSAGFNDIKTAYTYGSPGKISWKISMKYPIFLLNTSVIFAIILPFYYILAIPFMLILNYLDVRLKHSEGTGLLVIAKK
ncbi:MAG: methyltransferase domain-containing protein [Bacteroidales bacterium]|nr:methyltransferase domain-containing protein [Bacteroidales bacterium]